VCSCTYAQVLHSDEDTAAFAKSCINWCNCTTQSCYSCMKLQHCIHAFTTNTDLHQRSRLHTHSAVLMLLSYMELHIFVLQYISAMRAAAKGLHYEAAAAH
jgi:hypothetical protein